MICFVILVKFNLLYNQFCNRFFQNKVHCVQVQPFLLMGLETRYIEHVRSFNDLIDIDCKSCQNTLYAICETVHLSFACGPHPHKPRQAHSSHRGVVIGFVLDSLRIELVYC